MSDNLVEVCHECPLHEFRKPRVVCSETGKCIVTHHARKRVCPFGFFDHPLPPHERPPVELTPGGVTPDTTAQAFRAVWNTLHRRPSTLAHDFDREAERRWLAFLPLDVPKGCGCKISPATAILALKVGAARAWWAWALEHYPIDLTSLRSYHDSLVRIHNAKNAELDKPQLTPARAARIHGCTHLLTAEEIAADVEATGPVGVYLNVDWGLGDAVCLTASLRDVHAAWPGEYEFFLQTCYSDVFRNLPGVYVGVNREKPPELRYQLSGTHHNGAHLIDFLREKLSVLIGRKIPAGQRRPWLVLGEDETPIPPINGPFWLLSAGHRLDITTKVWPPANWQAVIDALPDISFVRVGAAGGWNVQPPLTGVAADLTGKTTIRELIRLIAHPNCIGVLGGESSAIHIAAGFGKRMVCVAGDRMKKSSVSYEGGDYLGDNGFACGGCVKYRVAPLAIKGDKWPSHDKSLCVLPTSGGFASCMEAIKPADVIARWPAVPPC